MACVLKTILKLNCEVAYCVTGGPEPRDAFITVWRWGAVQKRDTMGVSDRIQTYDLPDTIQMLYC